MTSPVGRLEHWSSGRGKVHSTLESRTISCVGGDCAIEGSGAFMRRVVANNKAIPDLRELIMADSLDKRLAAFVTHTRCMSIGVGIVCASISPHNRPTISIRTTTLANWSDSWHAKHIPISRITRLTTLSWSISIYAHPPLVVLQGSVWAFSLLQRFERMLQHKASVHLCRWM